MAEIQDSNKEQEAMHVARTLRMAFERDAGPGNSVNSTQNPWIAVLQGHFDLLRTARHIVEAVDQRNAVLLAAARAEETKIAEEAKLAAAEEAKLAAAKRERGL